MYLKTLSLLSFKNIAQARLTFGSGINALVGDNGAGKTNIVDAIYYLSMSKSMVVMTDGQSVRHGEDFFVLDGEFESDEKRRECVVCSYNKRPNSGKVLKRNGKVYDKLSEHVGLIPIVVVSPQDSSLIHDAAEERRRFLNAFISQMDSQYLNSLMRYNSLLQLRNKILKTNADESILSIYDSQMAIYADYIYAKRRDVVTQMEPLVGEYYALLSGDRESVSVSYKSTLAESSFIDLMQSTRAKDMVCEHTTAGVHRDDLVLQIGGYPLRKYGSQGQQKSFLIALKLAQFTLASRFRGERPILLLDDLFDKLDAQRVEQLIRLVSSDDFGQIFITDCNRDHLEVILSKAVENYSIYNVSQGEIEE